MKKLFLLCAIVLVGGAPYAQLKVGDNPTSIGGGQLLELEKKGQRGGLKLAEVALTGATDITTIAISASAEGTMVWNNGTAGLSPAGIYVWTGSAWVQAKTDNLYTANGTLAANRTVALANHSLAFTSTASTGTSHFSVDGATLNVDAHNNRVGIGTATPTNNLEVNGAGGTATGLKLPTGAGDRKVLVSDENGNASWQNGYHVYSEIYSVGGTVHPNSKITSLSQTTADNVKARYGAAYGWDNTNKQWVAPFSGLFRLTINVNFFYRGYNMPRVNAYINGSALCGFVSVAVSNLSSSDPFTAASSTLVELNAGDYVEFKSGSQTVDIAGGAHLTFIRVESVE